MTTALMVHADTGVLTCDIGNGFYKDKSITFKVRRRGEMVNGELVGGDVDEVCLFTTKQQLISLSEQIIESTRLMVCAECEYLTKKNTTECEHGWSWPDCEDNEVPEKEEHDIPDYLFEGER